MGRKVGIVGLLLVMIFALPYGGAAAQTVPDSSAPPLVGSVALSAPSKLTFLLQQLADTPQLWHSSRQSVAAALNLPASGAGSLMLDANGRVLVEIRMTDTASDALATLSGAGAQLIHVSPQYRTATAQVAPSDLEGLAQLGVVENVMEVLTPLLAGEARPGQTTSTAPAGLRLPTASTCPVGIQASGGITQLAANLAHAAFGVTGAGVKVGILSDSYDAATTAPTHASQDVASGDLPGASNTCGFTTPVHVISDTAPSSSRTDEGRAMAQIVHDLAPGAELGFATAVFGELQFGDNIRALRNWGAKVIADDVFYFDEPMFQEGTVSVAIADVIGTGTLYFTSAGNNNITIAGHEISSYETPAYRPSPVPSYLPFGSFGLESCHNFTTIAGTDPTYGITLASGGSTFVVLQWAQPWYGVTSDFDVIVSDAANTVLIAYSHRHNAGPTGTQRPFEYVQISNASGLPQSYNIHVCRTTSFGGDTQSPRFKMLLLEPFGVLNVEYPISIGGDIVGPAISGHSASLYSMSVAAARENDNNNPETFSSPGPATHYFGPVINSSPAAAIAPVVIHQPDFTATDGNCTTFFIQFTGGCYRFFGTSAASPHAAAVAALMVQTAVETPTVPLNQGIVRVLLQSTAAHMSGGDANTVGAGLVQALDAITKQLTFTLHLFLPLVRR